MKNRSMVFKSKREQRNNQNLFLGISDDSVWNCLQDEVVYNLGSLDFIEKAFAHERFFDDSHQSPSLTINIVILPRHRSHSCSSHFQKIAVGESSATRQLLRD